MTSGFAASAQDKRASLSITAICNPQNMGKLEKAAQEELDRIVRDGVTADEVDRAKKGYLQARKVGRSSDVALTGELSGLRHLNRTMAHDAEMDAKIEALTPEAVSAALKKHIDPKKLLVVVAGDFNSKPETQPQ